MKDIDFDRSQIVVRRGKGQKDRTTTLPAAAIDPLRRHLVEVNRVHAGDREDGFGWVVLPDALERKYPSAAAEWGWQFVFPASPRTFWRTDTTFGRCKNSSVTGT